MKTILLNTCIFLLATLALNAQTDRFSQDFQPVRAELTKWDPVRGEWLASSMVAISNKQPIPDRNFPENYTPAEMLRMVPSSNRIAIQQTINNQSLHADSASRNNWTRISNTMNRPSCQSVIARSFGDPHMNSFDGASYSLQTVGEFVLAKSETSNFEIQTRQQPQANDFSLNTAVAMNVGGDRVCVYANEKPDMNNSTALRVEGMPVSISRETYFLPHGGTIRYSSNTYVVTWPTGEVANLEMRLSGTMNFINVTVQIYPCAQTDMRGLLGNGNGRDSDDFDVNGSSNRSAFANLGNSQMQQTSNEIEKERLAFLAKDFARAFRLTPTTTLFDYGFGMNTMAYTDESYPRVHHTVNDLPNDRRVAAQKHCEDNGVRGNDMDGCIFDNAYLQIPASPRPVIKDPTTGVIMSKVERPAPNVNPGSSRDIVPEGKEIVNPNTQTLAKPVQKESVNKEVKGENTVHKTVPETQIKTTNTPVFKPTNSGTSKPSTPVNKPAGTTIKPSAPAIKTTPTIKPGKG